MRKPQWCVRYKDIFGNDKIESFKEKTDADKCYESLLPRTYGSLGDIERVSPPVKSFVEAVRKIHWTELGSLVRSYLTGFYPHASNDFYEVVSGPENRSVFMDLGYDEPLFAIYDNYNDDDRGEVRVINLGLEPKEFDDVFELVKDASISTSSALGIDTNNYPIDVIKVDKNEDCGSSAASLGAVPTGGSCTDDESVVRTRKYGR